MPLITIHYYSHITFVLASPDQGHDRPCRCDVGRVFLAGVRPDSLSRRRIQRGCKAGVSGGAGRGVVVELGQRGCKAGVSGGVSGGCKAGVSGGPGRGVVVELGQRGAH